MMVNRFYEAILEGRYQLPIDMLQGTDDEGAPAYLARYADAHGVLIEVVDSSHAEAHRRCTADVLEGVRDGRITPTL
jgi:hypothetical protein